MDSHEATQTSVCKQTLVTTKPWPSGLRLLSLQSHGWQNHGGLGSYFIK